MIIATNSGEKILFDKLDDLRNHVDDNILEALQDYIDDKLNQQDDNDVDYYKGEIDGLEEELDGATYTINETCSKIEELLDSIDNDIENKEDINNILYLAIFGLKEIKSFLEE